MPSRSSLSSRPSRRWRRAASLAVLLLAVWASAWLLAAGRSRGLGLRSVSSAAEQSRARALRDAALARAEVWRPSTVSAFDFAANPPDPHGTLSTPTVECRWQPRPPSGTTPKFDCALSDGEIVRVKYGRNPEIQAELLGTRLLAALGFGADRVYSVARLRCFGCPRLPFEMRQALMLISAGWFSIPSSRALFSDFEWVAVERRFGRPIEADDSDGWAWFELPTGAGRARHTRDALRLMAAFLAHWDNKAANQRLVCLTAAEASHSGACAEPFAIIQDLGATFGPRKLDLSNWRRLPVWADPRACTVTMRALPWGGGTFVDAQISEGGRRLLARQLGELTDRQLHALFASARVGEYERDRWLRRPNDVAAWVQVFQDKIRQVAQAGPCRI
jgi:hypothetical protein